MATADSDAERRLLEAVLARVEDGFTVQDASGRLLLANEVAARLVGFDSPEQMMAGFTQQTVRRFEILDAQGAPFPLEKLPGRAVLAGAPASEQVLVQYRVLATGRVRWSTVRAYPVLDSAGKLSRVINVFRDVTDEHREAAQRQLLLRAVEQFNASLDYDATLRTIAKEMVPTLADWSAVDILQNGELRRLAVEHVDPEKVKFVQEIARRYPADPSAPGSPRSVMSSGKPYLLPVIPAEMLRAAAKDAEHLELIDRLQLHSAMVVPIIGQSGPLGALSLVNAESRREYTEGDVAFVRTLADRAASAIEKAQLVSALEDTAAREKVARERAEEGAKFSEMLVGIVSHDLRNPLSAIGTSAQLIVRNATDDKQRRPAIRVVNGVERMSRMIDQLLDLTRLRLGTGLSIEPRPVDLAELAEQIADETEQAQECEIEVVRAGNLAGQWDGDRLVQVLSNLLANAAIHGTRNGEPISARLDGTSPAQVTLQIRNPGVIASELLPAIFEPFKGNKLQRAAARGLGLGLYITREIVAAHRGTITVESADDHTTFSITLPRSATR